MAYLTTGPVDEDQFGGDLDNWHAEVFNNTDSVVTVTLRVFELENDIITEVDRDVNQLEPGDRDNLTANTNGNEHTIAIVEHPLGRNDVLVTVYGRNDNDENLPGATYRHTELIELPTGVRAFRTNVPGV